MPIADIKERLRLLRQNSGSDGLFQLKPDPKSSPVEPLKPSDTVRSARVDDVAMLTSPDLPREDRTESKPPGEEKDSVNELRTWREARQSAMRPRSPGPTPREIPLESPTQDSPTLPGAPEKKLVFDQTVDERGREVEGRHGMGAGSPPPSYEFLADEEDDDDGDVREDGRQSGHHEPSKTASRETEDTAEAVLAEPQRVLPGNVVPPRPLVDQTMARQEMDRKGARGHVVPPTLSVIAKVEEDRSSKRSEAFSARRPRPDTPHPLKQSPVDLPDSLPSDGDSDSSQPTLSPSVFLLEKAPGTLDPATLSRHLSVSINSLMTSLNSYRDQAEGQRRIAELLLMFVLSLAVVGLVQVLRGVGWGVKTGWGMLLKSQRKDGKSGGSEGKRVRKHDAARSG